MHMNVSSTSFFQKKVIDKMGKVIKLCMISLKFLNIGTPKTINLPFFLKGKLISDAPRCPLQSLKCCILCRVVAAYKFKYTISYFVNEIAVQTKLEQFVGGHKIFAKIDNGPSLTIPIQVIAPYNSQKCK